MTTSIKELYAYALVEGEGVGTAYEYFAKRRVMRPVMDRVSARDEVLVAGLPEKYGTSLDFILAAHERGARCLVVDDRAPAIEKAKAAIASAQRAGHLTGARVRYVQLDSLADIGKVDPCAVALSCEVLQRVPQADRAAFARDLKSRAPAGVLFVPNSENGSHLKISGLAGFTRAHLAAVMASPPERIGFTDMPPFPPGITRSAEQRDRASSGTFEAVAMAGLQAYCMAEPAVPDAIKRRVAHIVYATW
jgi:hypothetical protein